jgi:cytidyltransferase-like protein
MDKVGVIHGRFQMLHIGHMEYLLEGKARCEYLLIGITNPDTSSTKFTSSNPHRSSSYANPLTYYERMKMIQGALLEAGVCRDEFDVVPFPINCPELVFNYVPMNAKYYMTIYDDWSIEKKEALERLGCSIEVMWTRTNEQKAASGTQVRECIIFNRPWRHLVPQYVYDYVTENGIDLRLKDVSSSE